MTETNDHDMRDMCRDLFSAPHETDQAQMRALLSIRVEHDTNPTEETR